MQIFQELSATLSCHRPESVDVVVCPLCLRHFSLNQIKELSVEHIVPSALGGTIKTLTCRECNNLHGSRLDSQLVAGTKAMDALEGLEPLRASWLTSSGRLALDYTVGKGVSAHPNLLTLIAKGSHPAALESSHRELYDGASLKLKLNFFLL